MSDAHDLAGSNYVTVNPDDVQRRARWSALSALLYENVETLRTQLLVLFGAGVVVSLTFAASAMSNLGA